MKGKQRRKVRLLRYLALLALVTSLGVSGTLAKYSSSFSGVVGMRVAAFAGGGVMTFDDAMDNMRPGDSRTLSFEVTNVTAGQICEVGLDYEIQVETTGNLPLTFSLSGEQREPGTDSNLAVFSAERLTAPGGFLPAGASRTHGYTLTVTWDAAQSGEAYSYEIDMVTVKVTATQANPSVAF